MIGNPVSLVLLTGFPHATGMTITMKTVNLCIFGDSMAYGAWDDAGGWVDRLRQYLHGLTLDSHFQSYYFVYNLGIPGNTAADVLARLPGEAAAREPHVMIFAVGINDSRWQEPGHVPQATEAAFRENIARLIADARRFAPAVVCIGLTPVDEHATMPFEPGIYFENERIRSFNDTLRQMAKDENVLFCDISGALSPLTDLEDGLHPNRAGHEKLFMLVRDFLTERGVI